MTKSSILEANGENNCLFECKDLDTKESKVIQYQIRGLLKAANWPSRK